MSFFQNDTSTLDTEDVDFLLVQRKWRFEIDKGFKKWKVTIKTSKLRIIFLEFSYFVPKLSLKFKSNGSIWQMLENIEEPIV